MIVIGVADGRTLYDTLHDKIHPLGVSYPVFYDYLNCNVKSPCSGWMNNDASTRDSTTFRAQELNAVYKEIIATHKFSNFDV
jgi:acyloxyacyl hydrolase